MTFYRSSFDKIPPRAMTNFALVLDLDESLVHTSDDMNLLKRLGIMTNPSLLELRKRTYTIKYNRSGSLWPRRLPNSKTPRSGTPEEEAEVNLWGTMRPHLKEFLVFCFSYFRVIAVWSAGQQKYVSAIVDIIFRDVSEPQFIYSYDECVSADGYLRKPIIKMMLDEPELSRYMTFGNTFFIDDRKSVFRNNPENGIQIPKYQPPLTISGLRSDDLALLQLIHWLKTPEVMTSTDIQTLDKSKIFTTSLTEMESIPSLPVSPRSVISNSLFDPLL